MKKYLLVISVITVVVVIAGFKISPQPDDEVPYPEGYRKWTHIKTGFVGPQNPNFKINGGFHHIYANEKAVEGYLSGKFPEGSMIVFDVLEGEMQQNSNIKEGKRRHVDVMAKDSTKYISTGGWGYEEFEGKAQQ